MNNAFYIGATALEANQRAVDVLAANIANANSTAYKRSEVQFSELMNANPTDPSEIVAEPFATSIDQEPGGVQGQTSSRIFDQGPLNMTGRSSDIAINGDGFFELLGPSGQLMLWRGGTLEVNADGYLAATNGYPLKQLISVPDNAGPLQISTDGKVSAVIGNASTISELGQIGLAHVRDTSELTSLGAGLYSAESKRDPLGTTNVISTVAGQDGAGVIVQGAQEASNVSLTTEMTNLLLTQRTYSANAQVVQAADQLMGLANSLRHT